PYVPGLAGDPVALAELAHAFFTQIVLTNKSNLFFHYTARFPRHARSLVKRQPLAHSVSNPPGLFCQGCAQSVPLAWRAPPPTFFVTVHSKGVTARDFGIAHSKGVRPAEVKVKLEEMDRRGTPSPRQFAS